MPVPTVSGTGGGKSWTVVGQVATANTNRDGSGTIATLKTADTYGSIVTQVNISATGTTTAGVIRLYLHDGSNARLIAEVLVDAITPSVSLAAFSDTWTPPAANGVFGASQGILLAPGYSLRASTHIAETFNLVTQGYDL